MTSSPVPLEPTITVCYKPVEIYLQRLQTAYPDTVAPATKLKPLDAFLMWQLAAFLPTMPTIIDMAADYTLGASTVLWLTHPGIEMVKVPSTLPIAPVLPDWRTLITNMGGELDLLHTESVWQKSETNGASLKDFAPSIKTWSPIMICLAETEPDAAALKPRLQELFEIWPNAIIAIFNLGNIGESDVLNETIAFCRANNNYKLTALRELNPFFSESRLGLIYPKVDGLVDDSLQRLAALYNGNFQFLSQVGSMAHQAALQNRLKTLQQQFDDLKILESVASREVEAVHNSKPWRLATWLWGWRDRLKQMLGSRSE